MKDTSFLFSSLLQEGSLDSLLKTYTNVPLASSVAAEFYSHSRTGVKFQY